MLADRTGEGLVVSPTDHARFSPAPTPDEQSVHALQLIATVLAQIPAPAGGEALTFRERVVLTIACDALGLDDPVF